MASATVTFHGCDALRDAMNAEGSRFDAAMAAASTGELIELLEQRLPLFHGAHAVVVARTTAMRVGERVLVWVGRAADPDRPLSFLRMVWPGALNVVATHVCASREAARATEAALRSELEQYRTARAGFFALPRHLCAGLWGGGTGPDDPAAPPPGPAEGRWLHANPAFPGWRLLCRAEDLAAANAHPGTPEPWAPERAWPNPFGPSMGFYPVDSPDLDA